ncbi:WSC domain-containing protein [Aspergillus avenaceus]|uniref:WSC domain-containing protein n=1 Tax=Aspergillus avenaceus TaxID=36643 RepID=A0A5N6TLI3_ASPAV|nr:WSC domain-containing protein [Aspergillus avenaceus]
MKLFTMQSALAASTLMLATILPSVSAQDQVYKGCYSSSKPLEDQGSYTYQSNGYCQTLCLKDKYKVFAMTKGNHCLCGNQLPAESSKNDSDDDCSVKCAGWPSVMCGGDKAFSVYLTGLSSNVDSYSSSSTSSSSTESGTSTTSDGTVVTTSGGQTVVKTADSELATQSAEEKNKDSGSNTAAIAAGVVVGVVGFCALVGAIFFLWRFKSRSNMPNQYRNNDIDAFGGGKPMSQSSMSDSRFDGDFMAQRRQSNGSIDDDQDFSRRILQVTNPDRR